MLPISPALKKQILCPLILPRNTTLAVMFSTFFSKALASCSQPLPYTFFLQKLSESSRADWSGAMVYDSLVPRRSLLPRCPHEVWERAGERTPFSACISR